MWAGQTLHPGEFVSFATQYQASQYKKKKWRLSLGQVWPGWFVLYCIAIWLSIHFANNSAAVVPFFPSSFRLLRFSFSSSSSDSGAPRGKIRTFSSCSQLQRGERERGKKKVSFYFLPPPSVSSALSPKRKEPKYVCKSCRSPLGCSLLRHPLPPSLFFLLSLLSVFSFPVSWVD